MTSKLTPVKDAILRPKRRRPLGRASGGGGATIPAWVPTNLLGERASIYADYVNGRYWFNSAEYADETTFNAAAGGQVSGVTRIIGPYVAPGATELISNGTFDTDTTGWTPFSGAEVLAAVSGELQHTATSASNPGAEQQFASNGVGASQAFRLRGRTRRGTIGTGNVGFAYSSSAAAISSVSANVTVNTDLETTFAAEETSNFMKLQTRCFGSGKTGTFYSDNISVKECKPFKGMQQGRVSGFINGRTPASGSGTIVLFELNGNTTRNRIRVEYNIGTGAMTGLMQYKGTGSTFNMGTVANDTDFGVNFTAKNNGRAMWLTGGHSQFFNSGTVPGFPMAWIGRSQSGETWTSLVYSWGIYPDVDAYGDAYVLDGDSYVSGSGGAVFKTVFPSVTGRSGYAVGAGGASVDDIVARLITNTDLFTQVVIGIDGSSSPYAGGDTASTICDKWWTAFQLYRDFVAVPPFLWSDQAEPQRSLTIAIRAEMLSRWPTKTWDWTLDVPNTGGVVDESMRLGYPTVAAGEAHLNLDCMTNYWAPGLSNHMAARGL